PDRRHVLVVDDARHELIALVLDGPRLTIRARGPVGPYPASVAVQPDGMRATVASLWSRRVEVVDLASLSAPAGPVNLRVLHTVRLPFAPRLQCMLPQRSQVVVADAFGGHLAVVDVAAGRVVAVHELTGHNLRGLALSADGKQLLVAHPILDPKAATTRQHSDPGILMATGLRSIPLDAWQGSTADLQEASQVFPLGTLRAGAGDPAGVVVADRGPIAVALAGVDEVALVRADEEPAQRVTVGRRPTVIVAGAPRQPV